jgi:hypothetical protein
MAEEIWPTAEQKEAGVAQARNNGNSFSGLAETDLCI